MSYLVTIKIEVEAESIADIDDGKTAEVAMGFLDTQEGVSALRAEANVLTKKEEDDGGSATTQ